MQSLIVKELRCQGYGAVSSWCIQCGTVWQWIWNWIAVKKPSCTTFVLSGLMPSWSLVPHSTRRISSFLGPAEVVADHCCCLLTKNVVLLHFVWHSSYYSFQAPSQNKLTANSCTHKIHTHTWSATKHITAQCLFKPGCLPTVICCDSLCGIHFSAGSL